MSFDRTLVGVTGFVATGLTAFGVNKYQQSLLSPACLDAMQLQRSEEVLRSVCRGADNGDLVAFIFVGGVVLTIAVALSPLGNIIGELFKASGKT